jgi:hypothetical protein
MVKGLAAGTVALLSATVPAMAQDKSQYALFNPTPERQLREMTTDRPDTTESPFTVDAGHIQIETNLFGYTRSRADIDGAVSDTYELATTNIRIGLTNNAEVNVVWQPYAIVRTRPKDPVTTLRDSGIGGLDLRAKFNLWGNDTFDKTGSALALLPYVTLPTDRYNGISPEHVEGGLIVPLNLKLSDKIGLGLNGGVSWIKSSAEDGYHAEYLASASVAYEWTDKLGTYYEIAARFNVDDPRGSEVVVLGTGLTYAITDNLQLDAGVNFGVTSASDRINPFIGVSRRF